MITASSAAVNWMSLSSPCCPCRAPYIFGGGHISKSLSKVAILAGFAAVIVDDRESFANRERFPEAADGVRRRVRGRFPQADHQ